MVATIGAIGSSAAASSYYEADDYYADGGISPPRSSVSARCLPLP